MGGSCIKGKIPLLPGKAKTVFLILLRQIIGIVENLAKEVEI